MLLLTANMARCGEYMTGLYAVLTNDLNCVFGLLSLGMHLMTEARIWAQFIVSRGPKRRQSIGKLPWSPKEGVEQRSDAGLNAQTGQMSHLKCVNLSTHTQKCGHSLEVGHGDWKVGPCLVAA